ncbi:hypothetical protein VTI74DRAFT_3219 [Chaetomium olivicolor]
MATFDAGQVRKFRAVRQHMSDNQMDVIASPNAMDTVLLPLKSEMRITSGPMPTGLPGGFLVEETTKKLALDMCSVYRPLVTVGFDGDVVYCLFTNPFHLQAHPRDGKHWQSAIAQEACWAGEPLNTPTSPRSRFSRLKAMIQRPQASSSFSSEILSTQEFHGAGRHEWPDDEDDLCLEWKPAGFNLVAKLTEAGSVDGIFVVYNMFPQDEDGKRIPVTHENWSIPRTPVGKQGQQVACAKIANRLADCGKEYGVVWTDKIEHPVELVRVVRTGSARLLHATVD